MVVIARKTQSDYDYTLKGFYLLIRSLQSNA